MDGICSTDGRDAKYSYNILVTRSERKRPFGKLRCRRKDNIRIDPWQVGWKVVG
jgi:hypothetical protein